MAKIEIDESAPDTGREAVMYIGPPLKRPYPVLSGTVFAGGVVPEELATAADGSTKLAALLVPVSQVGAARKALKDKTSDLARAYSAVAVKGV